MNIGAEDRLRVSPGAILGDHLLTLSAPEPFPMRLSYLETQIRVLSGRLATLEARTLPARWARATARVAWWRALATLRVEALWRYLRMRWK